MACITDLLGAMAGTPQAGGSWGYDAGNASTSWDVDTITTTLNPGNTLAGGDTPEIEPNIGTANGVYIFNYTVGLAPCVATQTLTVTVVDGAVAGTSSTTILCTSDTDSWNLMDILAGNTGTGDGSAGVGAGISQDGVWTGSGTATGNGTTYGHIIGTASVSDDVFIVNDGGGNNVPDSVTPYEFIYTVTHGTINDPCTNCSDEITLYFLITAAADAGTPSTITICNAV